MSNFDRPDAESSFLANAIKELIDCFIVSSVEVQSVPAECRYILFNNDPSGFNVDFFQFLRADKITVVTRDLRDVYATWIEIGRVEDSLSGARRLVDVHKRNLDKFIGLTQNASEYLDTDRVRLVSFENFVTNSATREAWRRWLGVGAPEHPKFFRPESSSRNVGLYDDCDRVAIEYIWDSLERDRVSRLSDTAVPFLKCGGTCSA